MATNVTWDGITYSIPQSGEYNWASLTNFLVALGQKAAVAGEMKQEIRKALSSPVLISAASDYAVVTDLTVAGPVAVTMPAGSPGQIFVIVDGKGDAATNNITISAVGSDTIKGQPTLVLNKDRQVAVLQYNSSDSDWKLLNYAIPPGQVTDSDISGVISTAGKVSGSAITSGTIGGSTSINTSGALTVGGATALNGGVTLGDGGGDPLTINSTAVTLGASLNFDADTLVIDATNNRVGIGTSSPSQALDVVGTVNATTVAAATVNAGALNASGNTALGDASSDVLTINGTAVTIPNGLNIDSNTLVIDAANNRVGVGVASPTVALDVSGAVKVSTDLTVNGNTTLGDATSDTLTIAGNATQNGTGSFKVASGTTAERPGSPVNGMIRYNSDNTAFEGYAANAWSAIGGGGTVDKISQSGHGFAVLDVVYVNSSASYLKASATSATTAEVVGVVSRVIDANNFELTLSGEITGLSGLTTGGVYFLSDTTPGLATLTEPTTIGYVSVPIGVASSTTSLYIAPKRGYVVGGANARTQISLPNNTTQVVQNVSTYDAGEVAGWVYIDGTTDLRFYVQAQFVKGGDGIYDLAYQVTGDTPPAGFSMTISNVGVISVTLPSIAGYVSASINYALNAPAVGTNFPLSIDGAAVTSGTVSASVLPVASATDSGIVNTSAQTLKGIKTFNNGAGAGGIAVSGNESGSINRIYSWGANTSTYGAYEFYAAPSNNASPRLAHQILGTGAHILGTLPSTEINYINGSVLELKQSSNTAIGTTIAELRFNGFSTGNGRSGVRGNIPSGSPGIDNAGLEFFTSYLNVLRTAGTVNAAANWFQFNNSASWSVTSDERIKINYREITSSLDKMMQLKPRHFNYKNNLEKVKTGFVAQEFEQVFPGHIVEVSAQGWEEHVDKDVQTLKGIDMDLIPYLVKAIQELKAELDAVKAELTALKQ